MLERLARWYLNRTEKRTPEPDCVHEWYPLYPMEGEVRLWCTKCYQHKPCDHAIVALDGATCVVCKKVVRFKDTPKPCLVCGFPSREPFTPACGPACSRVMGR